MKLQATINDSQSDIEIKDEGGRVSAAIEDRSYEFDVHESGSGAYVLIANGQVFDCRVEGRPESGKPIEVVVGTERWVITLTDPRRLSSSSSADAHGAAAARILAPMPGKVVRVLVEVGSLVEVGDGILVVEAMKMQNEMKSPKAGTVMALNVETGATVNGGDVLAVIE
jgi:biotin carboxyl carrier protein